MICPICGYEFDQAYYHNFHVPCPEPGDERSTDVLATSPGLSQADARERAKELGGLAVSARNPEKYDHWILGGWPKEDDVWIVVDVTQEVVLDDGSSDA